MPIRGSQQVAEALKMLGVNLPAPAPMPDMQPGMPGYDPTTLANKIDNPSVMDPTWLNLLRTGQNTLERVGQMGKGLLTGGSEQPGPSAENLGAILGAIGPLLSKIVQHGSPHVFDKFDMGKVGTGHGAQSWGHGLYFSDPTGQASEFKGLRALVGGVSADKAKLTARQRHAVSYLSSRGIDPKDATDLDLGDAWSSYGNRKASSQDWKRYRDEFHAVKSNISSEPGALYDVDLPDDAIAAMMDLDAPMTNQPLAVSGLGTDRPIDAYWALSKQLGSPKAASAWLKERGVPGIKYEQDPGVLNYVVFDDQLPKIVKVTR